MNDTRPGPARFPHRSCPCDECPFRADNTDNPKSQFPAHRWDELSNTVPDPHTAEHPQLDDPMFGCHKGEPGTNADLACAGWLEGNLQRTGRCRVRCVDAVAITVVP